MHTKEPVSVDPEIIKLAAKVGAEQHLLAGLDLAIGQLYETRKTAVERLWAMQSKLRTLQHYTALAAEAEGA